MNELELLSATSDVHERSADLTWLVIVSNQMHLEV